jgi:signal recognition particle subunit SRP54
VATARSANRTSTYRAAPGFACSLEADVDFQVAKKFIACVKEKALGKQSFAASHQVSRSSKFSMTSCLRCSEATPRLNLEKPGRILIVGLNGSGKTTSSAKLARLLKNKVTRQP